MDSEMPATTVESSDVVKTAKGSNKKTSGRGCKDPTATVSDEDNLNLHLLDGRS